MRLCVQRRDAAAVVSCGKCILRAECVYVWGFFERPDLFVSCAAAANWITAGVIVCAAAELRANGLILWWSWGMPGGCLRWLIRSVWEIMRLFGFLLLAFWILLRDSLIVSGTAHEVSGGSEDDGKVRFISIECKFASLFFMVRVQYVPSLF